MTIDYDKGRYGTSDSRYCPYCCLLASKYRNHISCGEPQNAAHLLKCQLLGDGKGRSRGRAEEDEWCEAVCDFLKENIA